MTAFRILLVALWTIIVVYTGIVIANHGWGLLEIFFRDMAAMGWPGQFNLDFTSLLTLSALWVAWRHQFSGGGVPSGCWPSSGRPVPDHLSLRRERDGEGRHEGSAAREGSRDEQVIRVHR